MDLSFGLLQEQTQKLVMTAQMRQAIQLLQCTAEELDSVVAQQMLDNPLVEYEPPRVDRQRLWRWLAETPRGRLASGHADTDDTPIDPPVAATPSLYEVLDLQLRTFNAPTPVVRLARTLIGYLDENGYLTEIPELYTDLPRLAEELGVADALGNRVSHAVAERWLQEAISLLQSCEPLGIGARNLQECLRLQLPTVGESLRGLVARIIDEHLDDVAQGRLQRIAQRLGESRQRVQLAVDALRRLHPRPGLAYGAPSPMYVVPELTVCKVDGRYVVLTRDEAYPRLRWNAHYQRLLESPPDAQTERYLRNKQQAVEWLMRCLEQRRLTLYRVADAIVQAQVDFFEHGPSRLRPLTLREVAEQVGIHESTVSRATRGKYMQTPRGVLELKYFFSSELAADEGGVSAHAVKQHIRELVAAEDPRQPLSDQVLCERLNALGIRVSRRTVAKYREQLAIPSSNKRRRLA
jgi:RNA polymerase sigma-54 factor